MGLVTEGSVRGISRVDNLLESVGPTERGVSFEDGGFAMEDDSFFVFLEWGGRSGVGGITGIRLRLPVEAAMTRMERRGLETRIGETRLEDFEGVGAETCGVEDFEIG